MSTYRLRVKIGSHEFEAEGDEDTVLQQFEEFKKLIERSSVAPVEKPSEPEAGASAAETGLHRLFDYDEKDNLISLRVSPRGEDRIPDTILLLLLGYREVAGDEEVLVTHLKPAMQRSGLKVTRVDRMTRSLVDHVLVIKTGVGKGGKYRLSSPGLAKAKKIARKHLAQLV